MTPDLPNVVIGSGHEVFSNPFMTKRSSKQPISPATKRSSRSKTKYSLPAPIPVMLASLSPYKIQNESAWMYEIKWDGYRSSAYLSGNSVQLYSREFQNYNKYLPVVEALKSFQLNAVIDGELVVLNEEGRPDFSGMQKYRPGDSIHYYVFDLLWYDGRSLLDEPLIERRRILQEILPDNDVVVFSESFPDGEALFQKMLAINMEGVIGKAQDSVYEPGERSRSWLKYKISKRQEYIILGYTESDKGAPFRSLLYGEYLQDGSLQFVYHSGGGWTQKEGKELFEKLRKIEVKKRPFTNIADTETRQHYVRPVLVAEFEWSNKLTKSGNVRHPAIYKGLRKDKKAKDVIRQSSTTADQPNTPSAATKGRKSPSKSRESVKHRHRYLNDDSAWKEVDKEIIEQRETFDLGHCSIDLYNVERKLWNDVRKGDLIQYYHGISKIILPHIKDRPQSLNLRLNGAGGPPTFLKDMENRQPSCGQILTMPREHPKPGKRNTIDYLVANNEETLLFMVNTGCVDINPWSSRMQDPKRPDQLWIDIDPTIPSGKNHSETRLLEDNGFEKAIDAALATKEVLDKYRLKGFVKTSGKTGIHIYLPVWGYDILQVRSIAEKICDEVHSLLPRTTTRNETVSQRGKKVYLDSGQNNYTKTLAAPYSVRPYHEPLVSTPLDWKEVKMGLDRWSFNINSIAARISKRGDLFAGALSHPIALQNKLAIERKKLLF